MAARLYKVQVAVTSTFHEIAAELALSRVFEIHGRSISEVDSRREFESSQGAGLITLSGRGLIDGKYQLLSRIGEGGMGTVYRVRHLLLDKEMALKTFSSAKISPLAWQRFQREAQTIGKLHHGNIVQVFDFGICVGNLPYYTMELFSGISLAELLRRQGRLNPQVALSIFTAVAEALLHAHNHAVIHRDIKPANIFLDRQAGGTLVPKVVDFGLAKLAVAQERADQEITSAGLVFGSPLYMSPEQAMAGRADQRSDIYSFGCAFFEALTGRPPFVGKSAYETIKMHLFTAPPRLADFFPELGADRLLESTIARLLAKNPEDRYQSFDEVLPNLIDLGSKWKSKSGQGRLPPTGLLAGLSTSPASDISAIMEGGSQAITSSPLRSPWPLALIGGSAMMLAFLAILLFVFAATNHTLAAPQMVASSEVGATVMPTGQGYYAEWQKDGSCIFTFPPGLLLGSISWADSKPRCATGKVIMPRHHEAKLEISDVVCGRPALLSHFRTDDLETIACRDCLAWSPALSAGIVMHLQGIRALELTGTNVGDDSLPYFDQLPRLARLQVADTRITGRGIAGLKRLRQLTSLDIGDLKDASLVLSALEGSQVLQELAVDEVKLSRADLEKISTIKSLSDLKIDSNAVDGHDIESLCHLRALKCLRATDTMIGPEAIDVFRRMKNLQSLHISCSGWSKQDLLRLSRVLPAGCKVYGAEGYAGYKGWVK